jgi:hypothetical protein
MRHPHQLLSDVYYQVNHLSPMHQEPSDAYTLRLPNVLYRRPCDPGELLTLAVSLHLVRAFHLLCVPNGGYLSGSR